MPAQPFLVRSPNGVEIAVWRSGSGPPLVLVHGTTADHTRWSGVLPLLEIHFTVLAIDRRGRGASGDSPDYAIAHERDDVVAVLESIEEPVNLLGHSSGALCCLEAATRARNLRRLLLYEPPVPVGMAMVPPATQMALEDLLARGEREAAVLKFFRDVVRVPEPRIALLQKHAAWPGRVAAAHTLARASRIESDYRLDVEALRRIRTPTLLLLGGDSPPFFHKGTRLLHDTLPHARILEMAGQQHLAMDTAPEAFVDAVRSFLVVPTTRSAT